MSLPTINQSSSRPVAMPPLDLLFSLVLLTRGVATRARRASPVASAFVPMKGVRA
jgi:hypothetical protein